MNCPKCKAALPDKAKFCLECGASISSVSGESAHEADQSPGNLKALQGQAPETPSLCDLPTMVAAGGGQASSDLKVDSLSNRYELEGEIGRGGFAVVYKARDKKLGRTVAVKRLHESSAHGRADEQILARFRREAQAIAQLNHRNIVGVYDHDHDDDGDYIVMEYVEGGSLKDYIKARGGKLPLPEAIALIRGIAQGLACAHRKNLVHRDIKPANILLDTTDSASSSASPRDPVPIPKIVDFGLARIGSDSTTSMSGYGMGTPYYMPPEQRRDAKNVNHTADIYALGKTLYEMVTGAIPDNVDPEAIPPPPALAKIILKCIKSRPEDRYFSVDDLLRDLDGLHTGGDKVASDASPAEKNQCPTCGSRNPAAVKFCEACGVGLTRVCPECAQENSVHKKFCGSCGTDVEGFMKAQETLLRMQQYFGEKKWSRVTKEYGLLPGDLKLPGKKGKQSVQTLQKLNSEALGLLSRRDELKAQLDSAQGKEQWEQALKLVAKYREIDPGNDEINALPAVLVARIEERDFLAARRAAEEAEETGDYERAVQIYREFLGKHGEGEHVPAAAQKIERINEVTRLVHEHEPALEGAHFRAAEELRKELSGIGRPSLIAALEQRHQERQAAYQHAMQQVRDLPQSGDLAGAVAAAEQAVKLCPESGEAAAAVKAAKDNVAWQTVQRQAAEIERSLDFATAMRIYDQYRAASPEGVQRTEASAAMDAVRSRWLAELQRRAQTAAQRGDLSEELLIQKEAAALAPMDKDISARCSVLKSDIAKAAVLHDKATVLLAEANQSFGSRRLARCRRGCEAVLAIEPDHALALALRDRAIEAQRKFLRKVAVGACAAATVLIAVWVTAFISLRKQHREVFQRAEQFAAGGDCEKALAELAKGRGVRWIARPQKASPEWIAKAEQQRVQREAAQKAEAAKAAAEQARLAEQARIQREAAQKAAAAKAAAEQARLAEQARIQREATFAAQKEAAAAFAAHPVLDLGGGIKMEFVWIPPGEFLMGSPGSEEWRDADEPQHRVTLSKGFWMGKHEVTQEQWQQVMGGNPSNFKGARNPVEQVSWDDCQKFLKKMNSEVRIQKSGVFRLPTEAEWEYACRAGTTGTYAGDLNTMGWYTSNSESTTHPAGQKRANAWGLYDMHGNVWEWCQDWKEDYPPGAVTDPAGPSSGSYRVLRGGAWFYGPRFCRSAVRYCVGPAFRGVSVGFRVVVISR